MLAANRMIAGPVDAGPAIAALARQQASEQAADHREGTGGLQACLLVIRSGGAGMIATRCPSPANAGRPAVA